MTLWIVLGIVAVAALWFAARGGELFFVSVRGGKVLVVRGAVPQALLNDFADAVRKPEVRRGSIRAVKTAGGAQLYASGDIDEFTEQRLRNIFRLYPMSNLRAAQRVKRPTLGQVLGIAWLAWLLER